MSLLQDMMKRAGAAAKPVSGTVSTGGQTTTALVVPGAGTSAGTTTVGRVEPVAAKPAVTVVQAPAVSQAPVTVIQAPVTVIQSPAKPMSLLEKLAAAKKPPTVIENPVVVPAAAVPAAQVLTPEKAQEAAVAAGYDPNGIVPPDAPSRTSTAEEVAAANPVEKAIEEATEETTVEAVQITDAPAKRRRRTKAEMEAARAAEAAEAAGQAPGQVINLMETLKAATAPQAIPQAVETTNVTGQRFAEGTAEAIAHPERAVKELTEVKVYFTKEIEKALDIEPPVDAHAEDDEVTKIRKILTTPDQAFGCGVEVLFIDCLPGKGWPGEQPQDALDYVHAFNSLAASSAGVADYRLIRYESKGYLATAIKVYAKGLPKVLYVNSRMSGADVLLETIVPYVKLVYRGIL